MIYTTYRMQDDFMHAGILINYDAKVRLELYDNEVSLFDVDELSYSITRGETETHDLELSRSEKKFWDKRVLKALSDEAANFSPAYFTWYEEDPRENDRREET